MRKEVYKRFTLEVKTSGERVQEKFVLDKNIAGIKGIAISSNKPNLLYYRGEQGVFISAEEILPEGYESKLLLSGINVAPRDRFQNLGDAVTVGNGEMEVKYQDIDHPAAAFEAYKVHIYLLYNLK